jgi:hypothetical protein
MIFDPDSEPFWLRLMRELDRLVIKPPPEPPPPPQPKPQE